MTLSAMQSMYRFRVDRIWNELREQGKLGDRLTVPDLIPLDQYHYLSTDAADEAARCLGLSTHSHVLDIGSGVGGTARYLAWKYGCSVTGIELQPHLYEAAVQLTAKTEQTDRVQFYQGDFLNLERLAIAGARFQHWISLMVFLHIGNRARLLANCARVLKPGGTFYIEDYFQRNPLTASDTAALQDVIACPYLPTLETYLADLEKAGFVDLQWKEVTAQWQPWVANRATKFLAQKERYIQLHGPEAVASFDHFYQTVSDLFAAGNVGGLRIWGTYP